MDSVYATDPTGDTENIIIASKQMLSKIADHGRDDTLLFKSPQKFISHGADARLERDDGSILFRGFVNQSPHALYGSVDTYRCIARSALCKIRYAMPYRYAGGIALSTALSSDSPIQSVAYDMGLLWAMNSILPPGVGTRDDSTGIWTIPGLGSGSRGGGSADVYYDGHKCTNVSELADITGGNYRFFRDAGKLCVHGIGAGDTFGVVAVENAFDTGIRLGDLGNGSETLGSALDLEYGNFWDIIKPLLKKHGMILSLREGVDYTYLDGVLSLGRGSSDAGHYQLDRSDIIDCRHLPTHNPFAAVVVGQSEGAGWCKDYYSKADFGAGLAFIEQPLQPHEYLSPRGNLAGYVDDAWTEDSQEDALEIDTELDMIEAGDWIDIDMDEYRGTLRVNELISSEDGIHKLRCGRGRSILNDAFLNPPSAESISNYQKIQHLGKHSTSDTAIVDDMWLQNISLTHIAVDGTHVYTLDNNNDMIFKIKKSDWTIENSVGTHAPLDGDLMLGVDIDSDYIYIAAGGNTYMLDKSDLSYYGEMAQNGRGIVVSGDYSYTANNATNKVTKWKISTEAFVSDAACSSQFGVICLSGSYLYVLRTHEYSSGGDLWFDTYLQKRAIATLALNSESLIEHRQLNAWPAPGYPTYSGMTTDGTHVYLARGNTSSLRKYKCSDLAFVTSSSISLYDLYYYSPYIYTTVSSGEDISTYSAALALNDTESYPVTFEFSRDVKNSFSDIWATLTFTPDNFGADDACVLLSLAISASDDDYLAMPVDIRIYINDIQFVYMRNVGMQSISDLDITSGCKLDGTQESLDIVIMWARYLKNTTHAITCTGTVTGITKP